MMRRLLIAFALSLWSLTAFCGPLGGISAPDPYIVTEFPGQAYGNSNAAPLTPASSVIPNTWAVVVVLGQSLGASNAQGTYSTISANAKMLSIYGGVYPCTGPVLGASFLGVAGSNVNSPICQIADGLISGGAFPGVLMVPISINGTAVADWNGPQLSSRIKAIWNRMVALGLTTNHPIYVMWHQGEQDAFLGTPAAAYTTSLQSVASQWRSLGYTGPFIVATETVQGGVANSSIAAAQAAAVSAPLHIVLGANWDSLTGGTNRYDGTHPTAAGAIAFANLDVTVITNCHNTSC